MNGEPKFKRDEETGQSRAVIREETEEETKAREQAAEEAKDKRKPERAVINGVEVSIAQPERLSE